MTELTGLVLAGGGSTRMGRDKALIDIDGQPLVLRACATLSVICDRVLVAPGRRPFAGLPYDQVADAEPGAGPLAGIVGGLAAAGTPLLAVAAVDMPDLAAPLYLHLARRWRGEAAVVPTVAGRLQPLHAVWAVGAARAVHERLASGVRSPTAVAAALGARRIAVQPGAWSVDVDTPADLRRRVRRTEVPVHRVGNAGHDGPVRR